MTSKVQKVLTLKIGNLLIMFDLDFDPEKYFSVSVRTLSLSQQDILGYFLTSWFSSISSNVVVQQVHHIHVYCVRYVNQFKLEMVLMVRMIRFVLH